MDYEQYEADCERIREANEALLEDFENWLQASGLSKRTINKHVENVDFYINEFLLYEDAIEAPDGVSDVGMFLGYWFIRKAAWSSESSIRGNAASLKKFYTFLHERGMVTQDDLDMLKEEIKEEMPEWLATQERYSDLSITDMSEVWGI